MTKYAAILVGGRGKRLGILTEKIPKPLIKINNKEFLNYLLYQIASYNFKKIFLICKYKSNLFFQKFNNKTYFNSKIICIKENKFKDTGGALFELKKKINDNFFLFNGDSIFNLSINDINKLKKTKKIATIALTKKKYYSSNQKLSSLKINKNVIFLSKKGKFMNGGIYFFRKEIFQFISESRLSLEKELLPNLIFKKLINGIYFNRKFVDIGTKSKLKFIKNNIHKYLNFKCAFLDRDGVINEDTGYVFKLNKYKILQGVIKAIRYLKKKNYLVIVITNQSGIGRKYYSKIDFDKLCNFLNYKLNKNTNLIEEFFFCPHHPRNNCKCRKPKTFLVEKAVKEWCISKKHSFMIGDKVSDKLCAEKSKIKFFYKKKESFYKQIFSIVNN